MRFFIAMSRSYTTLGIYPFIDPYTNACLTLPAWTT